MNMQSNVTQLREEVGEMKNKVVDIEEGNFTPKMVEKIEEICQTGAAAAAATAPAQTVEEIQNLIDISSRESIAETEDRARRSKNAIVFGIPEAKSLEREDRIREEYMKGNSLMTKIGCLNIKPQHVRRLGEYKPNQDKPRPLRLIFESQRERDQVLENFRMTKKLDQEQENEDEYECVLEKELNIKRDMTRLKQKEEAELYQEWKSKNEQSMAAGDGKKWIRRNGKVVLQATKKKAVDKVPEPTPEVEDGAGLNPQ